MCDAVLVSSDLRLALPRSRWRLIGLAAYVGINVGLILSWDLVETHGRDWQVWRTLPDALLGGTIYHLGTELPFILSPVMAPVMAFVGIIGLLPWTALNVLVLLLLRSPLLIGLVLASVGFWTSVAGGNTFAFVFVAAVLAIRGSRGWAIAYMCLLILMPRPVQLPLGIWLLWTMPAIRAPSFVLFVTHTVVVLLSGYGGDWLGAMVAVADAPWSIGPSHWMGLAWLAIGLPLGAILLLRGHPGWAGLAVSSYWVPHYFLMPVTDLIARHGTAEWSQTGDAVTHRFSPMGANPKSAVDERR